MKPYDEEAGFVWTEASRIVYSRTIPAEYGDDFEEPLTDEQVEAIHRLFQEAGFSRRVTCVGCFAERTCPWAFDSYNVDNACLGEK